MLNMQDGRYPDNKNVFIKSPLNYTGGKTKLLPQILPLFPSRINTFYDLFCGGANVGINVAAEKVVYSDVNDNLVGLLKTFSQYPAGELIASIENIISQYGLSESDKNGYEVYGCDSASGLAEFNRERFLKLRKDFNSLNEKNDEWYLKLYVLIVFAFNNQIRFNKKQQFNLPVGKRDFNKNIKENFIEFVEALGRQNNEFLSQDFQNTNVDGIGSDDFVYCDPPYLIATASYNEQDGWTEQDEKSLFQFLDVLDAKGVKFALSNVTVHKGRRNELLIEWAKKYTTHSLTFNYRNSNYHGRNIEQETQEVLITNY